MTGVQTCALPISNLSTPVKDQSVRVVRVPEDAWLLQAATAELRAQFIDIDYYGEGFASWVCRCAEAVRSRSVVT